MPYVHFNSPTQHFFFLLSMREQIRIFFTALMFYTRIPCPAWVDHDAGYINKATRFFPLMGWIVGGIGVAVFYALSFVLPYTIALLGSMTATILATGAFHEDGFADVCDAFGGGWTKEQILRIMKDSRLGTYGTVGLIGMLGGKLLVLTELVRYGFPVLMMIMLAVHVLSRFVPVVIIFNHTYAREDDSETTKIVAKPVAQTMSVQEFIIALMLGIIPCTPLFIMLARQYEMTALAVCGASIIAVLGWIYYKSTRYFVRWIGGYTGDCLGAVQQISELALYVLFLMLYRVMDWL